MRGPRKDVAVPGLLLRFMLFLLALAASASAAAGGVAGQAYDAALPEQLSTSRDLCAYAPCAAVIPGADAFSQRQGHPPYVEAYRTTAGARARIGYVFLSTDIVDLPGYSG